MINVNLILLLILIETKPEEECPYPCIHSTNSVDLVGKVPSDTGNALIRITLNNKVIRKVIVKIKLSL